MPLRLTGVQPAELTNFLPRTPIHAKEVGPEAAPPTVTVVILPPMKTATSIPDDVFEGAERTASALGLSRNELYASGVREFIERYRFADVT